MHQTSFSISISCCLIFIVGSSFAMAARPFATDVAGTVAQSRFELECEYDFWKDATALDFSLKHGIIIKEVIHAYS